MVDFRALKGASGCDVRGRCCYPGRRQITKHLDQSAMEPEIVLCLGCLYPWSYVMRGFVKTLKNLGLLAASHKLPIKTQWKFTFFPITF